MVAEFKKKYAYNSSDVFFIPNNNVAEKFAELIGIKVFSYSDMRSISENTSELGFGINVVDTLHPQIRTLIKH